MKNILLLVVMGFCLSALAEIVHVTEESLAGGVRTTIAQSTRETGRVYETMKAPSKSGYVFTHWTISTTQAFQDRDTWGRAYDAAPYLVYEDTTLTANYLPLSEDTDGDGVADGYEIYWYGNLAQNAASDTDGDGKTFAEEIAAGTNPLVKEGAMKGPVKYADGALLQYNPFGKASYVFRSEPEGALFATRSDIVSAGTHLSTTSVGSFGATSAKFAYWKVNGVEQRDAWGRALNAVDFSMPTTPIEVVAVTAANETDRAKLYWYGTTAIAMDSDTDGDGKTFAEELAAGTNPLVKEGAVKGPVKYADGALLQYNPGTIRPYTVRSEPEGALFPTRTEYVLAGKRISTKSVGSFGATSAKFAYWVMNGVVQRDAWGRALDAIEFSMPTNEVELIAVVETNEELRQKLYWYGRTDIAMDSDTDGDGKTFAEELAAGTNPLVKEGVVKGPVKYADGTLLETNLQPYEQVKGAVVDDRYSDWAGFGGAVKPVVADVNGDGLWDLVVCTVTTTNVYINVGSKGSPEFQRGGALASSTDVDLNMNSTAKLAAMELDVAPVGALSATMWKETLLVSDTEGRIWYYTPLSTSTSSLHLNHKVWGGSFAGFAEGLQLAAVDWEDDGDLDCLCGTADGRLMLLRNPKIGRPTNLQALVGVDNVLLSWDPNAQSRIRGYKVYRNDEVGMMNDEWRNVSNPSLPSYRDFPETIKAYDYAVSSVSRFYTAGNSTPTVTESPLSEPVHAELGRVALHWTDATAKIGEQVTVMLSIDNSASLSPEGMSIEIGYDESKLNLLKEVQSGLFEGDKIAPGSGKLYEYVFEVVAAEPCETEVRVVSALMKGVGGAVVTPVLPERNAVVTLAAASSRPPYRLGDVTGDGVVDEADVRLLAKLKEGTGRKCTAQQLKAGDFNGNGRLDNADYQALRSMVMDALTR